jgi:hypothetical protein
MPIGFLLALQASGMVVDWLGNQEQIRMGKIGNDLEQAGINANIETSRLNSEEESLESMKQLRQNLGTQAAMLAARGTRAGAGTAALFGNESVGNFNADQRMRKMNEMGRENQLRAQGLMSGLHEQANESQLNTQFFKDIINKIPTSPDAWSNIKSGFSAKNGYGFGLTPTTGS